jgi:hypothetical protein
MSLMLDTALEYTCFLYISKLLLSYWHIGILEHVHDKIVKAVNSPILSILSIYKRLLAPPKAQYHLN